METFRNPTPEEVKMITLQFLGQNLGEIKELDKNIVNRTNTLRGNSLDIKGVLNSIPQGQPRPPVQQMHAPQQQQAPQHVQSVPNVQPTPVLDVLSKINTNLEKIVKLLEK